MPDQEILNELDEIRTTPTYSFIADGEECKMIEKDKPLNLRIDFGNMKVMKCTLDIDNFVDVKYGILWDGELTKYLDSSIYDFKLCFTKVGDFKFTVKYKSEGRVNGELIIFAHVIIPE